MLRPRHISLGQYRAPYQTEIENLTRAFPACFTAMSILPALDKAIADGKASQQQFAANAPVISFSATSGDIGKAVAQAQALRDRYNAEDPNTKYCNTDAPGVGGSTQHYKTVQAFAGIYQNSSGASAAFDTLNQANEQLIYDLNPFHHLPNLLPDVPSIPAWTQWLIAAAVALALYKAIGTKS